MPNKTIYITDADFAAWDQAAQYATMTGRSMSQLIVQLVTDHINAADTSTTPITAEVFMARIGPRLLTRALVEQLDYVPDRDCEPFGRIKPRPGDIDVHVLGRRTTDGSLVKAKRNRPEPAQRVRQSFIAEVRTRVRELIEVRGNFPLTDLVDVADAHSWSRADLLLIVQSWVDSGYLAVSGVADYRPGAIWDPADFTALVTHLPTDEETESEQQAFNEYLALPLILLAD